MAKKMAQNLRAETIALKSAKALKGRQLSLTNLVGTWRNCNSRTRGIVQADLRATRAGVLMVRLWGACTPTPCDWGNVRGIAYGEKVTSRTAVAFSAIYRPSFKETIVTGHLDKGTLILETYTRFKDGSGRSSYYSREYLCRHKR